METNWKELDKHLTHMEKIESYGTLRARKAFEKILGDEWIKSAVEEAISSPEHSAELAMDCLNLISSVKAVEYAYDIYKKSDNDQEKRMAVWLIKHIPVKESFIWVEEFLNDKNVIGMGIGVLDQLLWTEVIDYPEHKEKIDHLFELAIRNSNGELTEDVNFIVDFLRERSKS